MSDELYKQIHANLHLKETDELLEIWQTNDRTEWSDTAFEVIRDILTERKVEVPVQNDPIYEHVEEVDVEKYGFSDLELKIIDDENPPDFYDPFEVLNTSENIDYAAKAAIVVSLLALLPGFIQIKNLMDTMFYGAPFMGFISIIGSLLFTIVGVLFQIIFTYFPLKALAHILRILMEMEFKSREVN